MLAGMPIGAGLYFVFVALNNYLADAFTHQAASALSAASFTRNGLGAVLPLAAPAMYASLGIARASTVLAALGALMTPIPFAFLKWGPRWRQGWAHEEREEPV